MILDSDSLFDEGVYLELRSTSVIQIKAHNCFGLIRFLRRHVKNSKQRSPCKREHLIFCRIDRPLPLFSIYYK